MSHPYQDLPPGAFWRSAIARPGPEGAPPLWQPKFPLPAGSRVVTIGGQPVRALRRALAATGLRLTDAEPAPETLPPDIAAQFGYGRDPARFGDITTARQFRDLLREVTLGQPETECWEIAGRFHDARRPGIEPEGFDSPEELLWLRQAHLKALAGLFSHCDLLILCLSGTEDWLDRETGRSWPVPPFLLPGADRAASPERWQPRRAEVPGLIADLTEIRDLLQGFRRKARLLLMLAPAEPEVSFLPGHVLISAQAQQASLRVAMGEVARAHRDTDYFPALEMLGTTAGGPAETGRMCRAFLTAQGLAQAEEAEQQPADAADAGQTVSAELEEDLICEERLLEAFSR